MDLKKYAGNRVTENRRVIIFFTLFVIVLLFSFYRSFTGFFVREYDINYEENEKIPEGIFCLKEGNYDKIPCKSSEDCLTEIMNKTCLEKGMELYLPESMENYCNEEFICAAKD